VPKLTVDGKSAEFPAEKRLVLAIESLGINIGHRCGGKASCTTCRVEFVSGEPASMTKAEYDKLLQEGLLDQVRLSCQLTCEGDMEVKPLKTLEMVEQWKDTGPAPAEEVVPEAEWFPREELAATDYES
jgi:ferredoxin